MTELLSNVHRHAQPDKSCTVEMELLLDRLTVSVRDHDPRLPEVAETAEIAPLATCGRGLAMVAAVSESWGVRPDGDNGKVVWFTLPAPPATKPKPARPRRRTAVEQPAHSFVEAGPAACGPSPVHAPARSAVAG